MFGSACHSKQLADEKNNGAEGAATLEEAGDGGGGGSGGEPHGRQRPADQEPLGDVFGCEDGHDIKYKTLSWPLVATLMITEIVSYGLFALPSTLADVGVVPGIAIIFFLGVFATYTARALIHFKLRHPHVHNMGDAGMVLFGPIGRDVFGAGTVVFAVFAAGSQIHAGQLALSVVSGGRLCAVALGAIFSAAMALASLRRTLGSLGLLSVAGSASIVVAGVAGLVGAVVAPVRPGEVQIAVARDFTTAFISVTNPVFAYTGHSIFFVLISEMKNPQDAMKAATTLQITATSLYIVFALVSYWYIGSGVSSTSLLSLSPLWQKIAFAFAIPNFLIGGSLYSHVGSKLVFIRLFRRTKHMYSHTTLGWGVWTLLIVLANVAAFLFAVGIPIFNYLVNIASAAFLAWYTYGLAGAFWLHDTYYFKGGSRAWFQRPLMFAVNIFTVLAGALICIGGLYVTIVALIRASEAGELPPPFQC
ncbi:putative amino acid transporter [Rosellinia necatrix]|uniref:Putative amino acid transporter n=1 Tax=Rosellinia necatrix TaxID=77044 RepID=A0A1W2TAF0_ROSNE|nr:putative amino acid transporter [Rosellinia necatrix]